MFLFGLNLQLLPAAALWRSSHISAPRNEGGGGGGNRAIKSESAREWGGGLRFQRTRSKCDTLSLDECVPVCICLSLSVRTRVWWACVCVSEHVLVKAELEADVEIMDGCWFYTVTTVWPFGAIKNPQRLFDSCSLQLLCSFWIVCVCVSVCTCMCLLDLTKRSKMKTMLESRETLNARNPYKSFWIKRERWSGCDVGRNRLAIRSTRSFSMGLKDCFMNLITQTFYIREKKN